FSSLRYIFDLFSFPTRRSSDLILFPSIVLEIESSVKKVKAKVNLTLTFKISNDQYFHLFSSAGSLSSSTYTQSDSTTSSSPHVSLHSPSACHQYAFCSYHDNNNGCPSS